jgi:hypothetical protein
MQAAHQLIVGGASLSAHTHPPVRSADGVFYDAAPPFDGHARIHRPERQIYVLSKRAPEALVETVQLA